MSAQSCISISELHPNFSHLKVTGIVIGKCDVRGVPDRKNNGADRYTFGFTIRDSPDFFINVTAWGNSGYINGLSSSFIIGDCVNVENPRVSCKDPEKADKFSPETPSLYRLTVAEAHSLVYPCTEMNTIDRMLPLIHLPVKDYRDFYSLRDIVANGQKLNGSVINVLAAVKWIGELKQFTTSDGRKGQRLEVKLFDDSVPSFPLICWDRETIQLVQTWIPKETVLFIADARINFDSFRNGMTATVNSKTIITVNPDTREASLLFSYAKEVSETGGLDEDEKPEHLPIESITDVYTVSQLKQKAQDEQEAFFGITYSFISKLDLNSTISKVIRTWCTRCMFLVSEEMQSCSNPMCPGRDQSLSSTTAFDLLVDLTDHTGTLRTCNLKSPVAEKTLGCTTEEFTKLTEEERTTLKWKFLLERCKIHIKIVPSNVMRTKIRVIVLACSLADPGEVKQHMWALQQRI